MPEPLVYLTGRMVPASQAHLNIYDLGVVMGATVTEMTRTIRHQQWRLEDHLKRLYRSLKYTRMNVPEAIGDMERATREVVQHNASLIGPDDELGIVHFVTAGENPVYAGSAGKAARITPTVCIHTFPMPFEYWAKKLEQGQHVVTPSIRHVPPQCYDPKMKYRSRMHYYLADHEARMGDPDAIALLLDLNGNVTETSGANFLIVRDGTIISPTTTNTLPGVSRAMIIELAGKLGIPFVERDFQVHDVVNADEAFTCSTPYCMLPVTKINGLTIGGVTPGPMFKRLMQAWNDAVGLDIGRQIIEGAKRRTATK
ncbi:MAG: aminotransferase class IV [Planctomycetaceae bacterium]|nr:aminotransferase class IV [Planctomycetaceae bacterium]